MADEQNVNVGDSSRRSVPVELNTQENANPVSSSSYTAYLAWSQYYYYYYTYSFYYYNAFYYNLLSRQPLYHDHHGSTGPQPTNNNNNNSAAYHFVQNNVGRNYVWLAQNQQGMVNGPGNVNIERTGEGSPTEIRKQLYIKWDFNEYKVSLIVHSCCIRSYKTQRLFIDGNLVI